MKDLSDSDDEEETDYEEEEEQPQPATAGKKRKAPSKKGPPHSPSAATASAALSPASPGPHPSSPASPAQKPKSHKRRKVSPPAALHGLSLFDILAEHSASSGLAAKEWLQRYRVDKVKATAELLTLLALAAGCPEPVSEEDVEEGHVDKTVKSLTEVAGGCTGCSSRYIRVCGFRVRTHTHPHATASSFAPC